MVIDKELAMLLISKEFDKAVAKFDSFNNQHEGYAVMLEEMDELWDDIKTNQNGANEAIQVGAMALRFLVDCCTERLIVETDS